MGSDKNSKRNVIKKVESSSDKNFGKREVYKCKRGPLGGVPLLPKLSLLLPHLMFILIKMLDFVQLLQLHVYTNQDLH